MQFGRTSSQRSNHREIQAVHILGHGSARATIFEEPHQIVDGVVPAVALVHDKGLQQRERRYGAVARVMFHGSRDRNDVWEVHHLRQIAADLQLRVDSFLQSTVDLQEERIANAYRRVAAALHRSRVDGKRCRGVPTELSEAACRNEAERAGMRTHAGAFTDRIDDGSAEALICACIRDDSNHRLLPHASHCSSLQLVKAHLVRVLE